MLELCRICLFEIDPSNSVSVYHKMLENKSNESLPKSIIEIMQECSSIEVFDKDDLPKFICVKCVGKLDFVYGFRNLIINSDIHLKKELQIEKDSNECFQLDTETVEFKDELKESLGNNCNEMSLEEINANVKDTNPINLDIHLKKELHVEEDSNDWCHLDTETIESKEKLKESLGNNCNEMLLEEINANVEDTNPINSDIRLKKELQVEKDSNECFQLDAETIESKEKLKELLSNNCNEVSLEKINANVKDTNPVESVTQLKENMIQRTLRKKKYSNDKSMIKGKKELYKCQECNKTFKSMYSFKKHNMKHTGVKPFSCEFCDKDFSTKWDLIIHTRVHTGDKPFSCDVCQKKFGYPSSLFKHKRIHNGVKKFHCNVCDKRFHQSGQLTVHMRSHTGEKPYMCEICSKTFGDKRNLTGHMGSHQQVEKIPCPICGKTYMGQTCLQAHIKRHRGLKPFVCKDCNQKFTEQTSLNRHKLLHTGIKPYKCSVCEKSFSQGSILVRHMRIHSGEKPFHCTLCLKEFAYKQHLQYHMKNRHKDIMNTSTNNKSDTGKMSDSIV